MNTMHFYRLGKDGHIERAEIRVTQKHREIIKPRSTRRPTRAEAIPFMEKNGWHRKAPR